LATKCAVIGLLSVLAGRAIGTGADIVSGAVAATNQNIRPEGANLTLRSVLRLAQREAALHGIPSKAFDATQFSYSCHADKSCEWNILYVGKAFTWHGQPAQPSMTPIVIVNDQTRRAHLLAPPPFIDVK